MKRFNIFYKHSDKSRHIFFETVIIFCFTISGINCTKTLVSHYYNFLKMEIDPKIEIDASLTAKDYYFDSYAHFGNYSSYSIYYRNSRRDAQRRG